MEEDLYADLTLISAHFVDDERYKDFDPHITVVFNGLDQIHSSVKGNASIVAEWNEVFRLKPIPNSLIFKAFDNSSGASEFIGETVELKLDGIPMGHTDIEGTLWDMAK